MYVANYKTIRMLNSLSMFVLSFLFWIYYVYTVCTLLAPVHVFSAWLLDVE